MTATTLDRRAGRRHRQRSADTGGAMPEFLVRQGLTLPRHVTTTAHLAAIYPFAVEAGLGVRGCSWGPTGCRAAAASTSTCSRRSTRG